MKASSGKHRLLHVRLCEIEYQAYRAATVLQSLQSELCDEHWFNFSSSLDRIYQGIEAVTGKLLERQKSEQGWRWPQRNP